MVFLSSCTSLYGTPTMFVDMLRVLREEEEEGKAGVPSLETGIMAGSPCPKQLCEDVIANMNMKDFAVRESRSSRRPVHF